MIERLEAVRVDRIGGLEMGAIPVIVAVTHRSASTIRPLPGFFVRKAVKDHGTKRSIEGAADIEGKNVVIVDDVTTTGESAMVAVQAAKNAGATVTLVLSIVDRCEGAEAFYRKRGIPFASIFTAKDFL